MTSVMSSNLNESVDERLKILEDLTSNLKQIQDDLLQDILTVNAKTEYLNRFLHSKSDKESFKENVPVVTYSDIQPFMERLMDGEPSHIISAQPISGFFVSSGTSSGKYKVLPLIMKYLENTQFILDLCSFVVSRHVAGVKQGKVMQFAFVNPESTTPSGLLVAPATTKIYKGDYYRNKKSKFVISYTSPKEIVLCIDHKQSMYCHLLCGLVQREEVVSLSATFASGLVRAINFLEENWKELCSNIRMGHLSEWITDVSCRNCVSAILGGPNPELASLIEQECNQSSWEGIITRVWPNTKFLECIITGQMAQYVSTLKFYSKNLPIFSMNYLSSETPFGLNMNPLCKPQDVSYTFMPNMAYFEFLLVNEANKVEIVDLVDVKLGSYYETLVTTYAGLYRYRMGDIVQVTGFHNKAPQFKFIGRQGTVLNVDVETTSEEEVINAVTKAKKVLESGDLMLTDFTCYANVSIVPGHYVFYWELKPRNKSKTLVIDEKLLMECCYIVEETLGIVYRKFRSKYGIIGALEIRVVEPGTFDSVMKFFISKGSSLAQYKTPIGIKSSHALAILENKVLARFISDKHPPYLSE